jgi:F0F1-type ATP synthase delta subunit
VQAQDKISVPYANGMLELAQERGNVDEVHKDLMTLQVHSSQLHEW